MRAPEPGEFEIFQHQTVPVSAIAAALSPDMASNSFMARIDVETSEIRYWTDGSAPTPTQGILAGPGAILYVYATDITRFRAVRTFSDAVLQVSYGRWPAGKRGSFY